MQLGKTRWQDAILLTLFAAAMFAGPDAIAHCPHEHAGSAAADHADDPNDDCVPHVHGRFVESVIKGQCTYLDCPDDATQFGCGGHSHAANGATIDVAVDRWWDARGNSGFCANTVDPFALLIEGEPVREGLKAAVTVSVVNRAGDKMKATRIDIVPDERAVVWTSRQQRQ